MATLIVCWTSLMLEVLLLTEFYFQSLWWLVLIIILTGSRIIWEVSLWICLWGDYFGYINWDVKSQLQWVALFPEWDLGKFEMEKGNWEAQHFHPSQFPPCGCDAHSWPHSWHLDLPAMVDCALDSELQQTPSRSSVFVSDQNILSQQK